MGINQKKVVRKPGRNKPATEEKFERDLKDCMHCRFFWGSDSRCIKSRCCKPEKKGQAEMPEQCRGCPYYHGGGYCFPCMKNLLGEKRKGTGKKIVFKQEEKRDG